MLPPLAKNIKRYFSFKEVIIVVTAIVISVSAGVGIFFNLKSDVIINDNEKQIAVKTMKTTVREVLEQNGIKVSPDDYISIPLDEKLQKIEKNIITIDKAVPVSIYVDGQQKTLMTYRDTVKEALDNSSFKLVEGDKLVGVSEDDKISANMDIKIVRVKTEVVNEDDSIPYKVVSRESNKLDRGVEKTLREGKEGINRKSYELTLEDGKEVAKKLISEAMVAAPIDKLIEIGTVLNYKTARGEVIRYKKVLDMRATAYTASFKDTGKSPGDPGFGITRSGMKARKGLIAVDPRVIPLGTKVYVEVAGNTPDYGYAVAADTGGAIKGNLIDLYFDDHKTVEGWGHKRVKVYIVQ